MPSLHDHFASRALLGCAGPALALVQYLAARAMRRYRLLAAMRDPLLTEPDHQLIAVLGTHPIRLDGLGDRRLAQIPVEHHARGAAQPRRPCPRLHSRTRSARQTVPLHPELPGADADAVGALQRRHRTHPRHHRHCDNDRDNQPRRPTQPARPPQPTVAPRTPGSCHERGKVTPDNIAVNDPEFRESGIGCARSAACLDG